MKQNTIQVLIGLAFLFVLSSNNNGSPGGKTNAPNEGSCGETGCHNTNGNNRIMISSNIPIEGYTPGETYIITVAIQENDRDKFGFELACYSQGGTLLNGFIGNDSLTVFSVGRRVTHKLDSTFGNGGKTWKVEWTAPSTSRHKVTFYTSVIAANGDNTNNFDRLFKDSYTVFDKTTASMSVSKEIQLNIYPNPCTWFITVDGAVPNANISVFDGKGTCVLKTRNHSKIDLRCLGSGSYVLKVEQNNRVYTRSFIKL